MTRSPAVVASEAWIKAIFAEMINQDKLARCMAITPALIGLPVSVTCGPILQVYVHIFMQ
jgi:hypothetical protein